MKTYENLLKAITGESVARNKYTFYAKEARKKNLECIARIFEETADNERAHAEELLEALPENIKTQVEMEISPLSSDEAVNLEHAAGGENYEHTSMYPEFKKIAQEEGLKEIASLFQEISEVEEKHEERYRKILKNAKDGTLHKREEAIEWKCLNCGYVHHGKEAPKKCPVCKKPQGWYEPRGINW
ncbi:MAG: Rubrerythrin [candidate division WS2 bacterium ADurb.Bin280]|uniref:Rubrerythrin n=1 Tax=candidate division WS2 bacterium ADurb.Bin280 TaxID=1852829 RepID=A0A1V5SF70_9BACT|nr:MAG: Rubrerythrin [candidate division WS2 bacterium ADurb.Bin280]